MHSGRQHLLLKETAARGTAPQQLVGLGACFARERPTAPTPLPLAARREQNSKVFSSSVAFGGQIPGLPQLPELDVNYEDQHSFSLLANWIIPSRVLLGRYPYVEPSRCSSYEVGERQLKELLAAGITTFVCLQDELPPQSEMRMGGKRGFQPYMPVATMIAASMQPPPSVEITGSIRNQHLDQFLPARRQPAQEGSNGTNGSLASTSLREVLQFLYCPIVDLSIPTTEQVQKLLADLRARLQRNEVLYIHCWGGRGRAGMIGACMLAEFYGIDAEQALQRVQRAFDTRFDEGRPSPETQEQRNFVRQYIAGLS